MSTPELLVVPIELPITEMFGEATRADKQYSFEKLELESDAYDVDEGEGLDLEFLRCSFASSEIISNDTDSCISYLSLLYCSADDLKLHSIYIDFLQIQKTKINSLEFSRFSSIGVLNLVGENPGASLGPTLALFTIDKLVLTDNSIIRTINLTNLHIDTLIIDSTHYKRATLLINFPSS